MLSGVCTFRAYPFEYLWAITPSQFTLIDKKILLSNIQISPELLPTAETHFPRSHCHRIVENPCQIASGVARNQKIHQAWIVWYTNQSVWLLIPVGHIYVYIMWAPPQHNLRDARASKGYVTEKPTTTSIPHMQFITNVMCKLTCWTLHEKS